MNARAGNEAVARYLNETRAHGHTPFTSLHIGAQQTVVASCRSEGDVVATIDLELGDARTSAETFGRYPPTPVIVEYAIMVVEDEVARARKLVAEGSVLVSDDASIREIARVAGLDAQRVMLLRLEAVERTFERLVAAALGKPAPGLLANPSFAGALLILREFMHHLGFSSINIVR